MTIGCGLGLQSEIEGVVQGWRISVRVWSRAGGSTKGVVKGWRMKVRVWSRAG